MSEQAAALQKPLPHKGLSPSSLALYMGCQRKYYYKKLANFPPDADAEEDYEAFEVGKAFHKVLEDTKHDLTGISYAAVLKTVKSFKVADPDATAPMIFAMLGRYRDMHQKAGLKAVLCEAAIETDDFYGIVDVVLADSDGKWWIGDMKTAANFTQALIPTLPMHPQLNLYAQHYELVAFAAKVDPAKYQGCRYRLTTKSKLMRKATEEIGAYIGRISSAVKSIDFKIPKELMAPGEIAALHKQVKDYIDIHKKSLLPKHFPQNFGNCTQYFRACDYWSRCHGKCNSEMRTLEMVEG